ncbi:MAG: GNAT family N-acetyltransferase [Hyphomicrobiaceae bacterium]
MAAPALTSRDCAVQSLAAIGNWRRFEPAIEAIFFAASGRTFTTCPERLSFRERWLGRYLERWPELAFVLLASPQHGRAAEPAVVGYLVGCLDNPAQSPIFSDLGYFQDLAPECARFPAHLHINLAPSVRGLGLGGRLIEAFAAAARQAGAPGLHVVTAPDARNVGFYRRQGFVEAARASWNGKTVTMLGRPLH